MDYGKAFGYVFEEDDWITKFLIGALVSLIPIINLVGYGYVIQVIKNVRDGDDQPLAEWDRFGDYFMDGLKFFIGVLIYSLPIILIGLGVGLFASIFSGDEPGVIFGLGMTAVICLMVIFGLLPVILAPALAIQYAKRDQIGDMFDFNAMWEIIKADLGNYFILLLMIFIILSFIASAGVILCGIGVILTTWYSYLVSGHLIGQLAREQLAGEEKFA